jgi:hypothetical protein
MPAFCKPMSARKKPMPAAIPSFRLMGIASISQAPNGESDREKKQHAGDEDKDKRELPMTAELEQHSEGKTGVEPHARRECTRIIGVEPHDGPACGSRQTGGDEHGAMVHVGLLQDGPG